MNRCILNKKIRYSFFLLAFLRIPLYIISVESAKLTNKGVKMKFTEKEIKTIEALVRLGDSRELAENTVLKGRDNARKKEMQLERRTEIEL